MLEGFAVFQAEAWKNGRAEVVLTLRFRAVVEAPRFAEIHFQLRWVAPPARRRLLDIE